MNTTGKLLAGSILDDEIRLETAAIDEGIARYYQLAAEAVARGEGASLKPAERMVLHWMPPMIAAVREEKRLCRKTQAGNRAVYGQPLQLMSADRIAAVTIRQVLGATMAEPRGVELARLAYAVGRDIVAELHIDMLRADKEGRASLADLSRRVRNVTPPRVNWWAKRELSDTKWGTSVRTHLGVAMVWLLIGSASAGDYDDFRNAFNHIKRHRRGRTVGYITLAKEVSQAMDDGHTWRAHMRPRYSPMVTPPYPWTADAQGGYIKVRPPLISKPRPSQKAALKSADLSMVHTCLNAINGTAWRINPRIYPIIAKLWDTGGGALGVPHADNFPLPPCPSNIAESEEAKKAWKHEAAGVHRRNARLKGARKEFLQKLGVADRMSGYERFYFPHQLDFRGRCYPIPPHLNHQGDDVCRGLLDFADPVPITDRGVYWLKVHAANCWGQGLDKAAFADRVAWVDANMEMINRCAETPDAEDRWHHADESKPGARDGKPWQFLAACMALTFMDAAMHLPVQLDGSCNGLQHYAAIGRDPSGAAVVNLLPSDSPADIYSNVAKAVAPLVAADAEQGLPQAIAVADRVTRQVVKRPVMTSVYGVTQVGAREQIRDELKKSGLTLDGKAMYAASMYLSKQVMAGIGEVCPAARASMAWLRECAKLIAGEGHPVAWVTPIGLPVIQPYKNYGRITVRTIMQKITMISPDEDVPVKPGKQADGIAPNFVHSLDAAHMMMTAREMATIGRAFAGVHDSFWTHASDVDEMAGILREQFVELHREPLLQVLHRQFTERYPMLEFPLPPDIGTLNIKSVMHSPYFFA